MDGDKKFVDSFSADQEVLVKNALKNVASVDFHEMFISSYAADSGKAIEVVCEIDVPDAEKAGQLDRNLDKTSMDFALRKEGLPGSTFAETKIGCKPPKREGLGTAAIVLLVLGVLVVVIMAVIGAAVWMRRSKNSIQANIFSRYGRDENNPSLEDKPYSSYLAPVDNSDTPDSRVLQATA